MPGHQVEVTALLQQVYFLEQGGVTLAAALRDTLEQVLLCLVVQF